MTRQISKYISNVLSPLLAPSYGVFLALWTSIICYLPLDTRMVVLSMVFGLTFILPLLFMTILYRMKIVANLELDNKNERHFPYMATIVCYLTTILYLYSVHSPLWLIAFMGGSALTCFVSLLVNFKWKISAHAAGMGGLVALLFYIHYEGLEAFNLLWLHGYICICVYSIIFIIICLILQQPFVWG